MKMMCVNNGRFLYSITIDEFNFDNVKVFKYLRSVVTSNNDCSIGIPEKIITANK